MKAIKSTKESNKNLTRKQEINCLITKEMEEDETLLSLVYGGRLLNII